MKPPTDYAWIPWVITATGWPASAFLAYRYGLRSKRIEREEAGKSAIKARRREFCSFLRGWKTDFARPHYRSGGWMRDDSAFLDVLPEFVQLADLVRSDLNGEPQKRFAELVVALAKHQWDFHSNDGYKQILQEHEELLAITENA